MRSANAETALAILGTRAAAAGSLELWDDANRDNLTVYERAVKKQEPSALLSFAMLFDAALSQCRAGRLVEGEANVRKA